MPDVSLKLFAERGAYLYAQHLLVFRFARLDLDLISGTSSIYHANRHERTSLIPPFFEQVIPLLIILILVK
jgi:hypothetical protein